MATAPKKADPRKGNNEPPFTPGKGPAPASQKSSNSGKSNAATGNNAGKAGAPPKASARAGGKNSAGGASRPNTRKR